MQRMEVAMRLKGLSVAAVFILLLILPSPAHTLSFDLLFTISSFNPPATPDPLNASITFDAAAIDAPWDGITAIDLTFEGHTYTLGEVDYINYSSEPWTAVGGTINGVGGIFNNTNDFIYQYDRTTLQRHVVVFTSTTQPNISYTSATLAEGYDDRFPVDISDATIRPTAPVPEPTTMLLFGAGLVGLAGFGRKKFKK